MVVLIIINTAALCVDGNTVVAQYKIAACYKTHASFKMSV